MKLYLIKHNEFLNYFESLFGNVINVYIEFCRYPSVKLIVQEHELNKLLQKTYFEKENLTIPMGLTFVLELSNDIFVGIYSSNYSTEIFKYNDEAEIVEKFKDILMKV